MTTRWMEVNASPDPSGPTRLPALIPTASRRTRLGLPPSDSAGRCVPATAWLPKTPLCRGPSLHGLRHRCSDFVRSLHHYYDLGNCSCVALPPASMQSSSDFPTAYPAASWRTPFAASGIPLSTAWISRVPHRTHPCMQRVYDSGEPTHRSRSRGASYCLPPHPTRSAFPTVITELNTVPALPPVNA